MILYANAINKTLARKKNIFDGAEVVRNMKNTTFEGTRLCQFALASLFVIKMLFYYFHSFLPYFFILKPII